MMIFEMVSPNSLSEITLSVPKKQPYDIKEPGDINRLVSVINDTNIHVRVTNRQL